MVFSYREGDWNPSSKSGLGDSGVGLVFAFCIEFCSRRAAIGAGCEICIQLLADRVIVQFKYVVGKPRSFVFYLDCSIVFNFSISVLSDDTTRKSSNVTAAITYDPLSPYL